MKKLIIILFLLIGQNLFSVPEMINYRGKLFENGVPVNGIRSFQFGIYNVDSGGVALWDSGAQSLNVNNGYYHYTFTNLRASLFTNENLYIDVNVEGTSLVPREKFVSVGYALNSALLNGQAVSNLQYWNKSTNDIFYTNGHVGLGVDSPLSLLHIRSTSADLLRLEVNGGFFDPILSWYANTTRLGFLQMKDDGVGNRWGRLAIEGGPLYFSIKGIDRISIATNGHVGIGVSTPIAKFEVVGNMSGEIANFFNDGNATDRSGIRIQCGEDISSGVNTLIAFADGDGTPIGDITFTGTTVSYNAFTGSHIGKLSNDNRIVEKGDVLVLTGENEQVNPGTGHTGEPLYGVTISAKAKDKRVIGVYGGKYSLSYNSRGLKGKKRGRIKGRKDIVLINAVGNCYVKVTDTNGDIEVGDFLTTSSRRGMAQKQDSAILMNYTLGKAQEAVHWKYVKVDPEKGYKWKYIPVALTSG